MIPFSDLKDFINSQPDDRLLNMDQPHSNESCGCILVHYGKEVLQLDKSFGCGLDVIECLPAPVYSRFYFEEPTYEFILDFKGRTYSEAKEYIRMRRL
jgi:hypothetical protein